MGSLTAPPCEENIVWFVHAKPIPLGSTALNMIKDALFATGKNAYDKGPNYDGSNR
jgi:carbonic anhydrase